MKKTKPSNETTKELNELLPKLDTALRYLHKVTGKFGIQNIDPLSEKRWSEKCWEHYHVAVAVHSILFYGLNSKNSFDEFFKNAWPPKLIMEKFDKIYPDLGKAWKK